MNREEKRRLRRAYAGRPAKATLPPHSLAMPTDEHGTAKAPATYVDGVYHQLRLLGGPQ